MDNLKNRLANAFFINFNNELLLVHPSHICHKCYCTLCNIQKKCTTSTLAPHYWKAHSETGCDLSMQQGATLKKEEGDQSKQETQREVDQVIMLKIGHIV